MDTVMVRERYKIVRVLEAENDYAFAESVDITERETPVRLLNIYEGNGCRSTRGSFPICRTARHSAKRFWWKIAW